MNPVIKTLARYAAQTSSNLRSGAPPDKYPPIEPEQLNECIFEFFKERRRTLQISTDKEVVWWDLVRILEETSAGIRRITANHGRTDVHIADVAQAIAYYLDRIKMLQKNSRVEQERLLDDLITHFYEKQKK